MRVLLIYILNSNIPFVNEIFNPKFKNINNENEMYEDIIIKNAEFSHNTYIFIDNNIIKIKNRLMNYDYNFIVDNINDYLNVSVYKNRNDNILEFYKNTLNKELQKPHFDRKGYYLIIVNNNISRNCVSEGSRYSFSLNSNNLEKILEETNKLEWE